MSLDPTPDGAVLWTPPDDARERTQMGRFLTWVEEQTGRSLPTYADAWQWSVDDVGGFWDHVWRWFEVIAHDPYDTPLTNDAMPGAQWFPGASVNYAEHAMRGAASQGDDRVVIVARSQTRDPIELTATDLHDRVRRCAAGLRQLGIGRGDRVAAYMPNIPETVVAFLATASIGAVWSSCAPEFGTRSVVDRLTQIDPKVLLTVDGYRYGSKDIDRTTEIAEVRAAIGSLQTVVCLPYLAGSVPDAMTWDELLQSGEEDGELRFTPVPFDHPLYVLYSSGTTGLPKPITHGHGGMILEHLKAIALQTDLGPEDRFFWFSTTGWMMWNYLVSGLLGGSSIVLFDGNPAYPDIDALWQLAEDTAMTYFGVSAPFLMSCRKAGLTPGADHDLSALRGVGSTGAPLPAEGFDWVYAAVGDHVHLGSMSGGTDVATAFVGASPLVPVFSGEIPCRFLGCRAEAYDSTGSPVIRELGELVITAPMPSMPVGFWGDEDGSRYREAYFEDFPGVWRHGDWITITERGSCIITGRSDATLNRGGVRLGTSEFYTVVDALPEVADSLVIHLEDTEGGTAGELLLFVATVDGEDFSDELAATLRSRLRSELSPRHAPDLIEGVAAIPRTLSGKRLEVPVKRILRGMPVDDAASRGALANPESLDEFVAFAARRDAADGT